MFPPRIPRLLFLSAALFGGLSSTAAQPSMPASEGSAAEFRSAAKEGNLFNEPFFQLSRGIASCKPPRGPWWTQEQARADAHWRTQSGVSCYLAGKCRLMNSYLYDPEIASRVKATFERDDRFARSSVWAHVQRRIVTLIGCVQDEDQRSTLKAAIQGIDDVTGVVDQLSVGAVARPPYVERDRD